MTQFNSTRYNEGQYNGVFSEVFDSVVETYSSVSQSASTYSVSTVRETFSAAVMSTVELLEQRTPSSFAESSWTENETEFSVFKYIDTFTENTFSASSYAVFLRTDTFSNVAESGVERVFSLVETIDTYTDGVMSAVDFEVFTLVELSTYAEDAVSNSFRKMYARISQRGINITRNVGRSINIVTRTGGDADGN